MIVCRSHERYIAIRYKVLPGFSHLPLVFSFFALYNPASRQLIVSRPVRFFLSCFVIYF